MGTQIAWVAFAGFIVSVACISGAVLVIALSDLRPTSRWIPAAPAVQPAVLLSILSGTFNAAQTLALSEAVKISWWTSAASGTESQLAALHMEQGGLHIFLAALATIITGVADGPLLQRSSNTVLGELVGDVVWNWHLAQEISGQMVGNVDREVPANVSVFELVQSATQGWYANKTIQDTGYPLCDGICPVTLRMPGVAVSCTSEDRTLDLVAPEQANTTLFSINYNRFDADQDIPVLMIESRFAKMIGPGPTCQALMQIDRCNYTAAMVLPVDGLTPSKGDSSSTPDGQPAGPLAALGWMAEYYLKSSATMSHEQNTTEYFWETQGVLANQYINFEDHFDCVPLFRSPTEYIQRSIHEVMFRIGWDAPKDNSTAAIKFETVIQQCTSSTIYQSNYTTMAVAISIMVITALATATLLWPGGFFGIKRPVSLSPIETAVVPADAINGLGRTWPELSRREYKDGQELVRELYSQKIRVDLGWSVQTGSGKLSFLTETTEATGSQEGA
ncbi:hypothetical protein QBC37DRAFT_455324 [Rhypophila decipiens]|uniref:Uncharacterized protein n=1 Tax=Rhypophila decipiens TaxID=261697 RepID=A0AAN6Y1G0_9PEZI|nr:hypothetical protein QBC37DRAFT_455324 [Rhypophila decipiens]